MAVKILRESSEAPNISNIADTKMIRYAYGGYRGFLQNYGNKLDYVVSGSVFKLKSGRLVVDGWEIEVEDNSWSLDTSIIPGTVYYTIYAEINILTETVDINSTYLTGDYPKIGSGDDLSAYPSGTASVELYHVRAVGGKISSVEKLITEIPYLSQIEERLRLLGFSQGEVTFVDSSISPTTNTITRQGNYVIADIHGFNLNYAIELGADPIVIATIPDGFRPKDEVVVFQDKSIIVTDIFASGVVGFWEFYTMVKISPDGNVYIVSVPLPNGNMVGVLSNKGSISWLSFGYEANPREA